MRERNVSRRTGIGESCKSGRHRADLVMATEMAGIVGSCLAIGVWHWLFVGRNIRSVCLYGDGRLLLVGMAQDWHISAVARPCRGRTSSSTANTICLSRLCICRKSIRKRSQTAIKTVSLTKSAISFLMKIGLYIDFFSITASGKPTTAVNPDPVRPSSRVSRARRRSAARWAMASPRPVPEVSETLSPL